MEEELILFDHVKLQPNEQRFDALGFMEEYTHLGTFILICDRTNEDIIKRLYEVIQVQSGDFKAGILSLSVPGFTVRIMANMTQDIQKIITACHQLICESWFDRTPLSLRKY